MGIVKGIVFNVLEELVTETHGEGGWDDVLEDAGVDGAYTSLGSYADEEFARLVGSVARRTGEPLDDVVRWVGRGALPLFVRRYPGFFTPHADTRSFVLTLNEIIHPEVRKLYPGADVPEFAYDTSSPDILIMSYTSHRRMCSFGEGLIEGAAAHYGQRVVITQPRCMKRGDPSCTIAIDLGR